MTDTHDPAENAFRLETRPAAARFAERRIAAYWTIATVSALTLAGVYLAGGQPQLEGLLLMISLGSLGLGFVVFARDLLPGSEQTAPRGEHGSTAAQRHSTDEAFERGEQPFVRRSFLLRLLGMAGGALGIAAIFPINSLGPHPGDTLAHTSWKKGSRLVTPDGRPVRIGDLSVDGVLTVFPEGAIDDADSQAILINVGDAPQKVRRGRDGWSVAGHLAFSKVCTHAGCPVGLYRSTSHQLLCPCHQSTFNVLDECRPAFGPATRSLPQLALAVQDGYLVAQHDFTEPVGPGYWNRP
ncbi:MAG: Rieske 2Fe-2S domain-containing protein [Actinomycetota bacterium]|nr:Rieske 2Fe-2S domain-containing protein [Actinomycetota bacterium]